MRSYYSPHWIFSLLSPSLFHLSIVLLDKNAFRRAPHFRQRIFIVNRFLPSRSFQSSLSPSPSSSACLSSYGTRLAAIFIDFPRFPSIFICPSYIDSWPCFHDCFTDSKRVVSWCIRIEERNSITRPK